MKQILVFILFAAMLCWMMFSPIYKHVLVVREAMLQKEVDYLLEVGASGSKGYIDAAMLEQSRHRLEKAGMSGQLVRYTVTSTDGSSAVDSSAPLLRGIGLQLTASYPYEKLFRIDSLIGISQPGPDAAMHAFGQKMSEFVP